MIVNYFCFVRSNINQLVLVKTCDNLLLLTFLYDLLYFYNMSEPFSSKLTFKY